jgi:hypothetical protein
MEKAGVFLTYVYGLLNTPAWLYKQEALTELNPRKMRLQTTPKIFPMLLIYQIIYKRWGLITDY